MTLVERLRDQGAHSPDYRWALMQGEIERLRAMLKHVVSIDLHEAKTKLERFTNAEANAVDANIRMGADFLSEQQKADAFRKKLDDLRALVMDEDWSDFDSEGLRLALLSILGGEDGAERRA